MDSIFNTYIPVLLLHLNLTKKDSVLLTG